MINNKKITVIIPVLNEEKSIAKVIAQIPKECADEILVIDNGCTDNTAEIARTAGARVIKEPLRGYGSSCLKGIAESNNPDIIVILDGDHSDFPQQMPQLVEPIAYNKQDFVLGSRTLGNCEKGALTPQQRWGNRLTTFLIKVFFGFTFTDMGPFRAIRATSLKAINCQDTNYGWNVEMQIKAIRAQLRIQEIPVDYRNRIGHSKISGTITGTLKAGYKILYTVFRYIFIK